MVFSTTTRSWNTWLKKVQAEVSRLQAKKLLIGECGHASRVAKVFIPLSAADAQAEPVVSILEYTHQAWKEGRLKLKPNTIAERVTYHDPCNFARNGWIVEQPRELLKAFCSDFVEMTPNRRDNICCGGGGGTVSIDEIKPYRTLVGGRAKPSRSRPPAPSTASPPAPTARSSSAS